MPLPELLPSVDTDERHQAAIFNEIYLASSESLGAGTRVACLSHLGVNLLLQRWVHHNSRLIPTTRDFTAVTVGPYEEADLVEEWCNQEVSDSVTIEQATTEAVKWLRQKRPGASLTRQEMLTDSQQRSTVRREMATELQSRREKRNRQESDGETKSD
jgi:hypothetical protein